MLHSFRFSPTLVIVFIPISLWWFSDLFDDWKHGYRVVISSGGLKKITRNHEKD